MWAFIKGLSGTITPLVAVIIRLVVSSILNNKKVMNFNYFFTILNVFRPILTLYNPGLKTEISNTFSPVIKSDS